MKKEIVKQNKRLRRKNKIRVKIKGTSKRPRLSVFKSNKGMFMQLIDDDKGVTLASASSKEVKKKGKKSEISYELGKLIAKRGQDKKISEVVFDRGGNKYHGRIQMAATGAREGGLKF